MRRWGLEFFIVVDIIGLMWNYHFWAPVIARFFQ